MPSGVETVSRLPKKSDLGGLRGQQVKIQGQKENSPEHVRNKALRSHDYFLENFLPAIFRYVVFRHHTIRLSTLVLPCKDKRGSTNLRMNYDIQ